MEAEKYPLDFEALSKGTWLEGPELEKAVGCSPDDMGRWRLGMLKLRQKIEEQTEILCCEDRNRLRLMTDPEAREHTLRRWLHSIRGQVRQVRRRSRIDVSRIPEFDHQAMESETRMMVGVTQATLAEKRKRVRATRLMNGDRRQVE